MNCQPPSRQHLCSPSHIHIHLTTTTGRRRRRTRTNEQQQQCLPPGLSPAPPPTTRRSPGPLAPAGMYLLPTHKPQTQATHPPHPTHAHTKVHPPPGWIQCRDAGVSNHAPLRRARGHTPGTTAATRSRSRRPPTATPTSSSSKWRRRRRRRRRRGRRSGRCHTPAYTHRISTHSNHPPTHFSQKLKTLTEAELASELTRAYEEGKAAGLSAAREQHRKEKEEEEERKMQEEENEGEKAVASSSSSSSSSSSFCQSSYHDEPPLPVHKGRRKAGECVGPRGNVWEERGFNYYVFRWVGGWVGLGWVTGLGGWFCWFLDVLSGWWVGGRVVHILIFLFPSSLSSLCAGTCSTRTSATPPPSRAWSCSPPDAGRVPYPPTHPPTQHSFILFIHLPTFVLLLLLPTHPPTQTAPWRTLMDWSVFGASKTLTTC